MKDETERRVEQLNDAALLKLAALSNELNAVLALEAQGADAALIQQKRQAVEQTIREMAPHIAELKGVLEDAMRKRG